MPAVLATGIGRELSAFGPVLIAALLAALTLFVVLALSAPRLVETALLGALFVVPIAAVIPALHPTSQNYTAYFALALTALTIITLLRAKRPPAVDIGVLFFSCLIVNWIAFAVLSPTARDYFPIVVPLTELSLYLLVLNRPSDRTAPILLNGIVLLGVAEASIGICQSLLGRPVFALVLPVLSVSGRGYLGYLVPGISKAVTQGSGTFEQFNGLGAFLTLASCVAFGAWLSNRRSAWRLIALCVIVTGVVTTYSRGSLLGTVIGCAVVYWLGARRNSRQTVIVLACVAAVFAVSISGELFHDYYQRTQNLSVRLATWSYGLSYVRQHPSDVLLGTGYSSFKQIILASTDLSPTGQPLNASLTSTGQLTAVHSGPLQILLELGVLGFVLYLATLATPIIRATRGSRGPPQAPLLIGATVGVLFTQLFDNSTFGFAGILMFALVALLSRRLAEERAASVSHARRESNRPDLNVVSRPRGLPERAQYGPAGLL